MNKKILPASICLVVFLVVCALVCWLVGSKRSAGAGLPDYTLTGLSNKVMTAEEERKAIESASKAIAESPESSKAEEAYMRLGAIYEQKQELAKAGEAYRKVVEKFPSSAAIQQVQHKIDDINIRLLFLLSEGPYTTTYVVRRGDNLTRVAKRFNTTVEYIRVVNGIKGDTVIVGEKIIVPKVVFTIAVDKSQNILTLKADQAIFKTYRVSTGKNNSTPVGAFVITNKIVDPPWYPSGGKMIPSGDPRNVLGSRWMGISKPSYGIHGTTDPGAIGKSVTEGCVRMKNSDVEELFSIVPEGTEVVITD